MGWLLSQHVMIFWFLQRLQSQTEQQDSQALPSTLAHQAQPCRCLLSQDSSHQAIRILFFVLCIDMVLNVFLKKMKNPREIFSEFCAACYLTTIPGCNLVQSLRV